MWRDSNQEGMRGDGTGEALPAGVIGRTAIGMSELYDGNSIMCHCTLVPRVGGALLRFRKRLWMKLILIALFWVAVYYAAISGSNAFMYFSF